MLVAFDVLNIVEMELFGLIVVFQDNLLNRIGFTLLVERTEGYEPSSTSRWLIGRIRTITCTVLFDYYCIFIIFNGLFYI